MSKYGGRVSSGKASGGSGSGAGSAGAANAAVGGDFHHRSNFGKDKKPFKGSTAQRTRSRSKAGGKVERAAVKVQADLSALKRRDRVNTSKQLLKQKRADAVGKKRVGSSQGPPRVVALIPLGASAVDLNAARSFFTAGCQSGSAIPSTNPLLSTVAYA